MRSIKRGTTVTRIAALIHAYMYLSVATILILLFSIVTVYSLNYQDYFFGTTLILYRVTVLAIRFSC